jgi:hypothetical protein
MKKRILIGLLLGAATLAFAEGKPQTRCPVMDEAISHKKYVDVDGYRIYVCCDVCVNAVKGNPEKYIKQMQAEGIEIEKTPQAKSQPKK